ncbi:E3 SUMO-protein ligase NSE2 [Galemys pyrenaicus]|uniref:E3 SUMO-protein ligase NSE2 n=1 Tax=Galemys pyrenaicus TaxID=202257 RepID=A0A8J6A4Y3_GALPY|nr:E3 SUMO-protein ligase NSE2 [Galemys pyrenaicus]
MWHLSLSCGKRPVDPCPAPTPSRPPERFVQSSSLRLAQNTFSAEELGVNRGISKTPKASLRLGSTDRALGAEMSLTALGSEGPALLGSELSTGHRVLRGQANGAADGPLSRTREEPSGSFFHTECTLGIHFVNLITVCHPKVFINGAKIILDSLSTPGSQQLPFFFSLDGLQADREADGTEGVDEDMIVTQSQTNFICPITQLEMKKPVKNKVCGHTYEEEAIVRMIESKHKRKKKACCPKIGCSHTDVRMSDLILDEALRRAIESHKKKYRQAE